MPILAVVMVFFGIIFFPLLVADVAALAVAVKSGVESEDVPMNLESLGKIREWGKEFFLTTIHKKTKTILHNAEQFFIFVRKKLTPNPNRTTD
ncbi:MAG: hypothetical protein Q8O83_01070 [bacterium]|nr:hypothetical protein [bacterium]